MHYIGAGYLSATKCLQQLALLAEVGSLGSTKLRKYTATVTQLMCLKENELEWLCNHMGHKISIHRDFYR